MKNLLIERYDNGEFHIIPYTNSPNHKEYKVHGQAPTSNLEECNIIDDIDQMTGKIIGKKAVMCPKKCAEKEAAKLADEEAEKNRLQQRADKIAALKENGSQEVKDLLELLGL